MNKKFEPGYHIRPPKGWLNDPNGLSFFKGCYHVFYQYVPDNPNGGLKYWGHYRSVDLIDWEECPVMLSPDQDYDKNGVYSGSAIIKDDKMYLFYTGNVKKPGDYDYINSGREHNTVVAVSSDGFKIDEKKVLLYNADYPEGLSCHVRDPKVFEYENSYYMVLGARTRDSKGEVLVYESGDLYTWKHINTLKTDYDFGYMWECPDLFKIDEDWILAVSPQGLKREKYRYRNIYSSGYFKVNGDFRKESTLTDYTELDEGFDFYAPQTFEHNGRRLMLAWMGMPDAEYANPTVKDGWQHCMSLFRELYMIGGKLVQKPAEEYKALRIRSSKYKVEKELNLKTSNPFLEIRADNIENGFYISIFDTLELSYDSEKQEFTMSHKSGADKGNAYGRTKRQVLINKLENLVVYLDASCAEVFINNCTKVLSTRYYPESFEEINFKQRLEVEIYELKPTKV